MRSSAVVLLVGVTAAQPAPQPPVCSIAPSVLASSPKSVVLHFSDGQNPRCVSVVVPSNAAGPLPVLFDFHGAGGSAHAYGMRHDGEGKSLGFYGDKHGFAVIGGESLQFGSGPPVPTDCLNCFKKAGCTPGPACVGCMKAHQFGPQGCSSMCGREHVPFPAAISAICGEDAVGDTMFHDSTRLIEADAEHIISHAADSSASTSEWLGGWHGGQWLIPEVQTDATGLVCSNSTSSDASYITNALAALAAYNSGGVSFNVSASFFTGCSMGSAMAVWIAQCMHQLHPHSVTAFASQSTGLKTKGDGLRLPPDNYQPEYTWGECPECKYFPAPVVPVGDGLKACIVDQYSDPTASRPDFYSSSLELNASWHAAGMRAEIDLHTGGHCATRSFAWIIECLDDGSGRLLRAAGAA